MDHKTPPGIQTPQGSELAALDPADDGDRSRAAEIDRVAATLARCVNAQRAEHDVSVPFAIARVLAERVAHDGGTLDDCIALVRAADASRAGAAGVTEPGALQRLMSWLRGGS